MRAAPDPALAEPVRRCHEDEPLDGVIPFSSLILLGVVVAVEDRFRVTVTRRHLARAFAGGSTLSKLAALVRELQGGRRAGEGEAAERPPRD